MMGINPPWYSDSTEFLAFNAFAMRTSQLEQIAEEFVEQAGQIDDNGVLDDLLSAICEENGISIDTLTEDEQNFLSTEINRRWS